MFIKIILLYCIKSLHFYKPIIGLFLAEKIIEEITGENYRNCNNSNKC